MTQTLTAAEAVDQAIAEAMRADGRVLIFGEGVASQRAGLLAEFGASRVRNAPLAEGIVTGTAVAAAAMGLRPVVDLLFAPRLMLAMDALVNSAGKLRYLSGGQFHFPLVVLAMSGAGWGLGGQHNHNLEALFVHCPGLKVVMPSSPADCRQLMAAAIADNNPVLFFMDLALAHLPGPVPLEAVPEPLGRAALRRTGHDVTLVSYAKTVGHCLQAADTLAEQGIDAEVIDLRCLKPMDTTTVLASVRKTGRLVVVHEANRLGGVGAELAATVGELAFDALKAPVQRLGGPDAPAAASWVLEQAAVPQAEAIAATAQRLLRQPRCKPAAA